ncbi:MAG: hypothetical protein GY768_05790 [Planctomycetaceae bacterium]|nr:hypothetical protein [Planctomycetaceae bacterium]
MSLRCFQIGGDGVLIQSPGELNDEFVSSDFDWLDLEDDKSSEIRKLLTSLGIDDRIIDECLHKHSYSRFLHVRNCIFFELPFVAEANDDFEAYMSLVYDPRCVVTIRGQHATLLDDVLGRQISLASSDHVLLLYVILEAVMKANVESSLKLRERIDELVADVDDPSKSVEATEILPLKRQLFRYMSIFDDQMYCLSFLSQADLPAFQNKGVRERYRDLIKSIDHVLRMMNRLERRLEYVQQFCTLTLQEKTNSRMKILTVFSAIFLPLSLIAGIYGMNFHEMPVLTAPFAYQICLANMGVIAGVMLLFFYWRGWFS